MASEFCGTSISSLGMAPERVAAALPFNPHVKLGRSDLRGFVRFHLDARQLQADLQALDDALDPASGIGSLARFVVDAREPGAQPA